MQRPVEAILEHGSLIMFDPVDCSVFSAQRSWGLHGQVGSQKVSGAGNRADG